MRFGKLALYAAPHELAAITQEKPLRAQSMIQIGAARGDVAHVKAALHDGVPIDLLARDGLAALHWAVTPADSTSMKVLLKLGSPVDVRSDQGVAPLINAVQSGHSDKVALLLAHGADPNGRDRRGSTAPHRAAEMGHIDAVKLLLEAGAAKDIEAAGHTPRSLAEKQDRKAVIEMLER